jgi:ribosomal protein S6--L-glutamate ligase
MRLCWITDKPRHPVLTAVVAGLGARHDARTLDPEAGDPGELADRELGNPADAYLLRSHGPGGLELARRLEQAGARVVNSWAATSACADRWSMGDWLGTAGLPWPPTLAAGDLATVLADVRVSRRLSYPVVVKSRWSRRGDVVRRVDDEAGLAELAAQRPAEPVTVQSYVPNDGYDRKLYVVDDVVLGLSRPSPLLDGDPERRTAIAVPAVWSRLARRAGRLLGLRVFGVDLLVSASGPVIVDVNAFPGFRGAPGATPALIAMIDRLAQEITSHR